MLSCLIAAMTLAAYVAYRHRPLLLGGDVEVYAEFAAQMMDGRVPYRDFTTGYPPLAVALFALPRLLGSDPAMSDEAYKLRFVLLMLAVVVVAGLTAVATATRLSRSTTPTRALLLFAVAVSLLTLVTLWRYDIAPAVCMSLALLAFMTGRSGWSGVWLGLGAAAKLYPAAVGPLFCVERLARRDLKGAGRVVAGGAAAIVLTVLPFAVLASAGFGGFSQYHEQRGVQLEAVLGGVILLGSKLGWTEASVVQASGAHEIVSPWSAAHPILTAGGALGIVVLCALAYGRFRQDLAAGADTGPALVGYSTLTLLLVLVTSKALSPQYLVWLLPMIPLLPPRHSGLLLACGALTALMFPWLYWELVRMEWPAVLLLNARNAVLILAAVVLLGEYLPSPARRHAPPLPGG